MAYLYYTALRPALSRLVGAWGASGPAPSYWKLLAGITPLLLLRLAFPGAGRPSPTRLGRPHDVYRWHPGHGTGRLSSLPERQCGGDPACRCRQSNHLYPDRPHRGPDVHDHDHGLGYD